MYRISGTDRSCCILPTHAVFIYSLGGITLLHEMTSWPTSWKSDVKSKIRLRQPMRINLENVPVKFHSDPIWNDYALGF